MAITSKQFAKFPMNLGGGDAAGDGPMDLLSDSLKLTLHTATWVPAQTTNEVKADATNELGTANGYTALGQALASKTYAQASLVTTFDAADVTWTITGTVAFRYGVVWDDTPTVPADPLIVWVDTGGDQTLSIDIAFVWNAAGLWTFTVA